LWSGNTLKKNRMTPVTRKHVCKKKCIVKKKNIRKKGRKKVILIRKKYYRSAYPQPEINVNAPQGTQGSQGPQGIQGPQGLPGTFIIPHASIMLTAKRYFYIASSDITLPADIPANQFTNDDGESILEFEFTDIDPNSYANLYINGIMQVGGSYRVSTNALTIKLNNDTIFAGTPIILETVQSSVQIIP
jgi:hypothetical protein